jgi:uncharacterized membrane protein YbhN (UPF0104 family)
MAQAGPPAEAEPARASRRHLKLALRVAAGVLVLALVVWYAHPAQLAHELARANAWMFALAVFISVCANLVSAVRWAAIARALGLVAPTARLALIYARGITTNILLPGATVSGDLLRSYQLASLDNPFMRSALSVFFDRFSGLWVLCVLSLLAVGWVVMSGTPLPSGVRQIGLLWYVALLAAIVAAPLLPWPITWMRVLPLPGVGTIALRLRALRTRLTEARSALIRSIWLSLGVQALSACALWVCGLSVGVTLSYPVILAAAAPIFIMAALPLGVAGFGTRELAAVLVFGFLGVPGDQATACALLFGLCAVAQGIAAAPLFLFKA